MHTFSGGEAVPAKILLLSGTSEGPVLARARLDAGAVHDLDSTTLMIRRPPEDDLAGQGGA